MSETPRRGTFITFEGGEGVGKSTQIRRLAERLQLKGHDVVVTREPGGSPGAEAVRHVLLSGAAKPLGSAAEAILFAAARADHIDQVIRPAVLRDAIVLSDRFLDSSRVYQGKGGRADRTFMTALERVAIAGMMPDLTVILDLDPEVGLRRVVMRQGAGLDRFEEETLSVHQARRQAFLDIAAREPERCRIVDASQDPEAVANAIAEAVDAVLERTDGILADGEG